MVKNVFWKARNYASKVPYSRSMYILLIIMLIDVLSRLLSVLIGQEFYVQNCEVHQFSKVGGESYFSPKSGHYVN
jgi:hypothetical protein